jgi:hypothetical protein
LSDWKVRTIIKTWVVLKYLLIALLGHLNKIVGTFWFYVRSHHWACERTKLMGNSSWDVHVLIAEALKQM